jgi:hypothetical protein
MLEDEENDSCSTPPDVAEFLPLKSRKIYEKPYGPRAEKCYFTPANSILKFSFTPTRAKNLLFYFLLLFVFIYFKNIQL